MAAVLAAAPAVGSALSLSYAYRLSTLTGVVRSSWVGLSPDGERRELYVLNGGLVSVFNDAGMEIYRFGDDEALGHIAGVAALDDGNLLAIAYGEGAKWRVEQLDYRGERLATISLAAVPAAFLAGFSPTDIAVVRSRIYLADQNAMKVIVLEAGGSLVAAHDLSWLGAKERAEKLAELRERSPELAEIAAEDPNGMSGFGVAPDGSLLVSIAPIFKVFVVSPDGKARSFGLPGGTPGKFAIISGVTADADGRIYVADALKSVVAVFDREFRFVGEYGYQGRPADRLHGPRNVALMAKKLYVSQSGLRGVNVYRIGE